MIVDWKDYFGSLIEKIDKVDTFKYVTYNKEVSVEISDDTLRFPLNFKDELYKKYSALREWVHEEWSFNDMQQNKREGVTFKRFKVICDRLEYQCYRFLTAWQKIEFKRYLEEDIENSYTILNNSVHRI